MYQNSNTAAQSGPPNWWTQYHRKLVIFNQVPDDNSGSNYTLRILYWKNHARLVEDSDSLTTPDDWERGIRLKATSFVFTALDQDEKAAAKNAEFERWVSSKRIPRANRESKQNTTRLNFGYRHRRR